MVCNMVEIETCNYRGYKVDYLGRCFIDPDEVIKIAQWNEHIANNAGYNGWMYIYYIGGNIKVYCLEEQHKRNIAKFKEYYDSKKINFSKRIFD